MRVRPRRQDCCACRNLSKDCAAVGLTAPDARTVTSYLGSQGESNVSFVTIDSAASCEYVRRMDSSLWGSTLGRIRRYVEVGE